eukprot:CAMPEP_0170064464 /NCGR_PEP_ID=MMETSP0019_2-20121128/4938_1 /TAXON_ID=98059 /ORGANISM="Dinobryon sp., Strain UTEXLB2267" /LENGTH=1142 /DNA_ID=CAMNT_0010271133 /DNA_START=213 /DNA_END=3641 /DNA_ORIENTATION=+
MDPQRNEGVIISESSSSHPSIPRPQVNEEVEADTQSNEDDDDGATGSVSEDANAAGNVSTFGSNGRWTRQEHALFLEALSLYGKEWKKVASMVKTRTVVQTRTHAQKYFQKVTKSQERSRYGAEGLHRERDAAEDDAHMQHLHQQYQQQQGGSGGFLMDSSGRIFGPANLNLSGLSGLKSAYAATSGGGVVPIYLADGNSGSGAFKMMEPALPRTGSTEEDAKLLLQITPTILASSSSSAGPQQPDFSQPSSMGTKRKLPELLQHPMPPGNSSTHIEGAEALYMMGRHAAGGGLGEGPQGRAHKRAHSIASFDGMNLQRTGFPPPNMVSFHNLQQLRPQSQPQFPPLRAVPFHEPQGPAPVLITPLPVTQRSGGVLAVAEQQPPGGPLSALLGKVRSCIQLGDVPRLVALLAAAEQQLPLQTHSSLPEPATRAAESLDSDDSDRGLFRARGGLQREPSSPPRPPPLLLEAVGVDLGPGLALQAEVDEASVHGLCGLLLRHGASATLTDREGNTGLHLAAVRGFEAVGRLLLAHGCPVNAQNRAGDAASHVAARHGHSSFVGLLALQGADPHLRNLRCEAALDLLGADQHPLREFMRSQLLRMEPRLRTLVLHHDDCMADPLPAVSASFSGEWEGPDRLVAPLLRLRGQQEFRDYELELSSQFDKAGPDLLGRVHSQEYLTYVTRLTRQLSKGPKGKPQSQGASPSPYSSLSAATIAASRRSAGAVAHAVERVLQGRNRNAFCLVRPPGHNAGFHGVLSGRPGAAGFSVFNGVAAGAIYALEEFPDRCRRVAIVDLDIHHGNGTEDIVRRYGQPKKLFLFSLHLSDQDTADSGSGGGEDNEEGDEFFPGTGLLDDNACNIVNVPLRPLWRTQGGSGGRGEYRKAVVQRLLPSLRAFNPDLILLSAGFDGLQGDLGNCRQRVGASPGLQSTDPADPDGLLWEAGMDLRPEDLAWLTQEVARIADLCCQGRIVSVLEGGYGRTDPRKLAQTSPATTSASSASASSETVLSPGANPVPAPASLPPSASSSTAATGGDGCTPSPDSSCDSQSTSSGQLELSPASSAALFERLVAGSLMNRDSLAAACAMHVHRLVDPYGAGRLEHRLPQRPPSIAPSTNSTHTAAAHPTPSSSGEAVAIVEEDGDGN